MTLQSVFFVIIYVILVSFTPAAFASDDGESSYWFVGMGILFGSFISAVLCWILNQNSRRKYEEKVAELNQAHRNTELAKIAMATLAKEREESQDLLEERVQERTLELNIALQELESANEELERKNVLDELTGLHNRRFYDQKILAEYRRCRRNLGALSLVVIDIDHFKAVNDNHGHLAGDHCLTVVAHHLKNSLKRSADKAFRYGGEEFCLILPNTDAAGAFLFAEQVRLLVSAQPIIFEQTEIPITISSGICTYQQEADVGPDQIFSYADKALYEAKHNGRNQTKQHTFTE